MTFKYFNQLTAFFQHSLPTVTSKQSNGHLDMSANRQSSLNICSVLCKDTKKTQPYSTQNITWIKNGGNLPLCAEVIRSFLSKTLPIIFNGPKYYDANFHEKGQAFL